MRIREIIVPNRQAFGTSTGLQAPDLHQELEKVAISTGPKKPESVYAAITDPPLHARRGPIRVPPRWEIDRIADQVKRLPRRTSAIRPGKLHSLIKAEH